MFRFLLDFLEITLDKGENFNYYDFVCDFNLNLACFPFFSSILCNISNPFLVYCDENKIVKKSWTSRISKRYCSCFLES